MTKESEQRKQERAREGAQAWAEYQAQGRSIQEKTARLRALRLARDAAANNGAKTEKKTEKK
jgi:hypothetical protein